MTLFLTPPFSQKHIKTYEKLSKDHKELETAPEAKVHSSLEESTQLCGAFKTLKIKEAKLYLEKEEISK